MGCVGRRAVCERFGSGIHGLYCGQSRLKERACAGIFSARSSTTMATSACAGGWPPTSPGVVRPYACGPTTCPRWPGWRPKAALASHPGHGATTRPGAASHLATWWWKPLAANCPALLPPRWHKHRAPPVWLNLEYLTAESYAARNHQLPSPVLHGPGAGLTKHFLLPRLQRQHWRLAA